MSLEPSDPSGSWPSLRRLFILPAFETPEAENAFWQERDARLLFFRRWMLLAGIVSFAVFAVVDVLIVEGDLGQILTIRAIATVLALALWVLFCGNRTPDAREILIGAIGTVAVAANLLMILVSGPPVAEVLPFSLSMIMAFGVGLVMPRLRTSFWTGLVFYVLYWLSVPFSQTSLAVVATNAHFLTLSLFAAFVGTFVREKLEREQAIAQLHLAAVNARAVEAGRAKDRMLASVSHELRTPVNAIAGFSEIMQREMFGPVGSERYRGYVDDIGYSARLLKTGIEDLLEVSRLEMNKVAWDETTGPLSRIVAASVSICEADAREAGVTLTMSDGNERARVKTDANRLTQVLVNVLSNAVKFSKPGDGISVDILAAEGGGAVVRVTDTGRGIAPDDLERIREPFRQVEDDEYRARNGGLGLGLAIADGFMGMMEGRMEIESELGAGTVVSVILPSHRIVRASRVESARRRDRVRAQSA